jgi:two-component system response regulator
MEQKTLLLVEDNPDDEALTLRALRRSKVDARIEVARDGAEAIERLLGKPGGEPPLPRPAVVLLDLKLPKIDGLEVLRRLRADARTRSLPIVILTTSKEDRDVVAGYDLGANSYVRKPVDSAEFAEAIRQLGAYWLVTNEIPPARTEKP